MVQTPNPWPVRIQTPSFHFGRFPLVTFPETSFLLEGRGCFQVQSQTLVWFYNKSSREESSEGTLNISALAQSRPLPGGGIRQFGESPAWPLGPAQVVLPTKPWPATLSCSRMQLLILVPLTVASFCLFPGSHDCDLDQPLPWSPASGFCLPVQSTHH